MRGPSEEFTAGVQVQNGVAWTCDLRIEWMNSPFNECKAAYKEENSCALKK